MRGTWSQFFPKKDFESGEMGCWQPHHHPPAQNDLPCVVRVEGGKSEPVIKTTQRARVGVFRSCLHWKTEPRPRFLARNLWGNGASAVTAKAGQSFRKRFSRISRPGRLRFFCAEMAFNLASRTAFRRQSKCRDFDEAVVAGRPQFLGEGVLFGPQYTVLFHGN